MSESQMLLVKLMYAANALGAGLVGSLTLFAPALAAKIVFSGTVEPSTALRIVGSFWLAIALLSLAGLAYPKPMLTVLVVQVVYKGLWLLVVAAPALIGGRAESLPIVMAIAFAVWLVILPFVIPWSVWLRR